MRSPELMTEAETATALGCSVRTIQRLRASGQIGSTNVGRTVYFSPADITEYIDSQRVAPIRERTRRKAS